MRSKPTVTMLVTVLVAAAAACGGERGPAPSALQTRDNAVLVVQNDHWLDVTIYAVRAGTRQRLGTVAGLGTQTLPIHTTIVGGAGTVRFVIQPIGSSDAYATEHVLVGPSDSVELHIRNPLRLTTFAVARR